jgi:hypothetical protein
MTSKSYYYLFIIFILACSFIFFCFSIINEQYKYGYVRYNSDLNPKNYNYLNYKIFSKIDYFKKKNFSNFNNNTLAAVKLLIPKKSLNYYKKNAPDSNKKWVNGFAYDEIKNKTYSIDLRPRGDNPSNWSFNKKSWKVKIDKKDFKGGIRKYYYELPRIEDEFYGLKFYSAYFLSREMGLPTPKIRFVELFINGINMGYYYELEQIDESFLRNNNLMPVNIYKGENYHIDSAIDTGDDLFNNSGLWTKLSYFNQKSKEDKTDLIRHLNKINLFEGGRINPNNFFDYFPVEKWAKHILSYGSVHSSNWHNQRLIIDPWSGEAVPIIHDPDFLNLNNNLLKSGNGDRAERVLNFNPEFHYYKYKLYKEFFIDKKIISKLINEINLFRDDLAKAIVKDFDYNFFKKICNAKIK